jgi:hypothetical protein
MKVTYKVGSIIEYRNFGDQIVQVEVDQKDEDIKNGRPGFAGYRMDDKPTVAEL